MTRMTRIFFFYQLLSRRLFTPRYPFHPRLKNNMPNGANHLSPNTYHFYSFLSRYEYNFRRGLRGLHGFFFCNIV